MGVLKLAFSGATNVVGGVFDGVGDRLNIAHINNKIAKATVGETGLKGFGARRAEDVKSLINYATLGAYRNMAVGVTHNDIKSMDDMSKSERTEVIAEKYKDKLDRQYRAAASVYDESHAAAEKKRAEYSK